MAISGASDLVLEAERGAAGEPALDLGAGVDRDRLIGDVAHDPRARLDEQGAHVDRAFDRAGDPRLVGIDVAGDRAGLALDELGAADVAVDAAVDMELRVGGEIAADQHFGADEGEARRAGAARLGQSDGGGLVA